MICYKCEKFAELGPDYMRLKNRFELTNGAHEVTSL